MALRLREKVTNTTKTILPQEGISSFIRKTYELLEDKTHADIVSWSEDGCFLVIKDLEKFTQTILPMYFRHNKMNSFVRQLNMYSFRKKRTMNSYHVYYNEFFKKGRTDLLIYIRRKTSSEMPPSTSFGSTPIEPFMHSVSNKVVDISSENEVLKKMNQKAFAKINSLESRVNELIKENDNLLKQISEKQKKEEYLHTALSHCFNNKGAHNTQAQAQSHADNNHTGMVKQENTGGHPTTPETASQTDIDTASNIDAFLNFESNNEHDANKIKTAAATFMEPSYSSSLGKRHSFANEPAHYDYHYNQKEVNCCENHYHQEPTKLPCLGICGTDGTTNLMKSDYQIFTNGIIEDTF